MKTIWLLVVSFGMLILTSSCKEKECGCTEGDLIGKWSVDEFMSLESVAYPKNDDFNPVIEFRSDGSYQIQLDANSCNGSFVLNGKDEIEISSAGCTKICCDSPFSEKFIRMLPQVESYSFEDEVLNLYVSGWGWIHLKPVSN